VVQRGLEPAVTEVGVPDSTAVRVALWRAMHVELDAPPHVLDDLIGLQLAAPPDDWRARPDMDPVGTQAFRAWIVARARFIEDLVEARSVRGVSQYVLLGAGLDTFAQRRPDGLDDLQVFEVDRPGTQAWKRQRLIDLGFGVPTWLHFVSVDFEGHNDWGPELTASGFDQSAPAVVASIGVSMYLSKETNRETLERIARYAPRSTLVMTFQLPIELVDRSDRSSRSDALRGARASGTPFVSFYSPDEILTLAFDAGFRAARHLSGPSIGERYFSGRSDGLRPSSGEDLLVATT
jgi:methyltransferase (TIGR00027 family)